MDIRRFWYGQLVTYLHLNGFVDAIDAALLRRQRNQLPYGVASGATVAAQSIPDMTVNVTAGVVFDKDGEQVTIPSTQIVDLSVDSSNAATTVGTPGNSKIVSIFARFKRLDADPFVDLNSVSGYFEGNESFEIVVTQGAEGSSPVAPSLDASDILLADVTIAYGATTVTNGDISTSRREDCYRLTGTTYTTPDTLAVGLVKDAIKGLLGLLNGHVSGSINKHPAADLTYAGSGNWANAVQAIGSTTVESAIDTIVSALASVTASNSGADRIGQGGVVGSLSTIGAGTLMAALTALKLAGNLEATALGAWADGTTNPAASVQAMLAKVVSDLASQGASPGAQRVGMKVVGNFTSGNVYGDFAELVATTTSNDGAKRVGAQASGNLAPGTVRSQIDSLDATRPAKASPETITGAWTFDDVTVSGTNHYKFASRSVTRVQQGTLTVSSGSLLTPASATPDPGATVTQNVLAPHGSTLTSISMRLVPAAHANKPAAMPSIALLKRHVTTGAGTTIGTFTDNSADAATYSTAHDITISGLSEVIDRTVYHYFVAYYHESGFNSAAGTVYAARTTETVTNVDDAY